MRSKIDAREVEVAFLSCLFGPDELKAAGPRGTIPDGAVLVEGIVNKFGFHPQRLEIQREPVRKWLALLPHEFRAKEGGGWSFLNACVDEDGEQWGEHQNVEQLLCLALGLGLAKFLMPREAWVMLPGNMPYFSVEV